MHIHVSGRLKPFSLLRALQRPVSTLRTAPYIWDHKVCFCATAVVVSYFRAPVVRVRVEFGGVRQPLLLWYDPVLIKM